MFVLSYAPSIKQKIDECLQGTKYSSDNIIIFFFKKKFKWNNYFELSDINFRYHFFVKSFNHYDLYFIKSQSKLILSTFDPKRSKHKRNSSIILFFPGCAKERSFQNLWFLHFIKS